MFDEKQLIQLCIEQKRSAQYKLYERFSGKIYALILRYVKNKDDAKDVMQNAFIKIYENLHTFRQEGPLEAWMKRIAVNSALKHLQKQNLNLDIDDEVTQNQLTDFSENSGFDNLNLETIYKCIDQLPEGCKTVFNLFAVEGFKHNEIAQMLNITEGTSKSQFFRAKLLLSEKIEILQLSK